MRLRNILIIGLLLSTLLLSGCQVTSENKLNRDGDVVITVATKCEDKVVCYDVNNINVYGESGSCFRDKDLIEKYCKE